MWKRAGEPCSHCWPAAVLTNGLLIEERAGRQLSALVQSRGLGILQLLACVDGAEAPDNPASAASTPSELRSLLQQREAAGEQSRATTPSSVLLAQTRARSSPGHVLHRAQRAACAPDVGLHGGLSSAPSLHHPRGRLLRLVRSSRPFACWLSFDSRIRERAISRESWRIDRVHRVGMADEAAAAYGRRSAPAVAACMRLPHGRRRRFRLLARRHTRAREGVSCGGHMGPASGCAPWAARGVALATTTMVKPR